MPEVYNWQLGRKMLYPYEERHPKWQFAFVFNINRCLACQTCSMADKSPASANAGRSEPRGLPQNSAAARRWTALL
jgi:nitrate reductase beta subunit